MQTQRPSLWNLLVKIQTLMVRIILIIKKRWVLQIHHFKIRPELMASEVVLVTSLTGSYHGHRKTKKTWRMMILMWFTTMFHLRIIMTWCTRRKFTWGTPSRPLTPSGILARLGSWLKQSFVRIVFPKSTKQAPLLHLKWSFLKRKLLYNTQMVPL